MKSSLAVVYLPFQIPSLELTEHERLLTQLTKKFQRVIVVLPVTRTPPSATAPFDFFTRQAMIQTAFPTVGVLPLPDNKYAKDRVANLHKLVASQVHPLPAETYFYSTPGLSMNYTLDGGSWQLPDDGWNQELWATHEHELRDMASGRFLPSDAFRLGVLYALANRYPATIPTVDIAIKRHLGNTTQILLGRKPGEEGWRFPGGFKDPRDLTYEAAALREAKEETNAEALTPPRYIGSTNINDWRYSDTADKITTVLFETTLLEGDVEAGDDLGETRWFSVNELNPWMMEGEHRVLLGLYLEARNG